MSQTIQTNALQIALLAQEIVARMQGTEVGHCARVDYLDLPEAHTICHYITQQQQTHDIVFHILTSDEQQAENDTLFITTDKVIELRNRKQERLCLFVPASLVDAAYSSISNSFALIDGRHLHTLVVKQVTARLSPELAALVRAVFARLKNLSGVSEEQRLDFLLALLKNMESGVTSSPGLELWRVGLIADASDAFVAKLDSNRDCTIHLSRPKKIAATMRERIQSLKVDTTTTLSLHHFFQGRAMNDTRAWSRALEEHTLTFDTWVFPETEQSDLRAISITPFVNARGVVERYCHLVQQDGISGSLLAQYGAKETITARWKTEPELPNNLDRWRIGIVPSGSDNGFEECLDERSSAGTRRTITIKLDMDFEEPPNYPVCIRIMPLSADGSEIVKGDTQEVIFADSHEFFLVKDTIGQIDPPRKSLRTVPTLAFGRLEVAVDMRENTLTETELEWMSKDLKYFRLHINERRVLNIGLNNSLLELEKVVLAEPRQGGCFLLAIDEVRPVVAMEHFTAYALLHGNSEPWASFWRVRETFFKRLRQAEIRSIIEVADWTPDLAALALRYAQTYRDLIDDLVSRKVAASELHEALSLDTLLIRNTGNREQLEDAVVILPTHPLRTAWFASYTQLLQVWEKQLLEIPANQRKKRIDLQALRLLVPTNVPAFAYHPAAKTTFTFFQNLRFFHGIALPAGVPDPHRRYEDVTVILDSGIDQVGIGDVQPDQLAAHIAHFQSLHNYTKTLVVTLINPDRGDFFAEAINKLPAFQNSASEGEQGQQIPTFQIISYAENGHKSTFRALEQVRQQQIDQQHGKNSDHLLPGLTTTARTMSQLEKANPPEAHIAVVTDFTRPTIVASAPIVDSTESNTSSFSLYGLINRFVSQFSSDSQGLLWRHRIITEGIRKPEPHPAGPRYSETLIDLQTTLLLAGGYLLGGAAGARPVLEVRLATKRRELLERLHTNTNWVITLDRFFTLDYYDSPHLPGLDEVSRKYVLDYSPEFTEGLGHRMMVTTAWHEEIGSLLGQAMDDLGFSSVEESVGRPHLFILGIPGQGKSWTIIRLLSELGRQQVPALVLDFHGQFADSQGSFIKAVHPRVFDAAKGLPFSPFECTRENGQGGWMANALAVAEIFAYVAGLGEIQKDIVYTSVRDAYKAHGFADENEEGTVLQYPTLKELLKRIEQNEQGRHTNNVAARCRPLLEMDLFRPPEDNTTDFLSLIRGGAVIDLHNLFAESLQMATGAFVLRKLYKDMFHWGETRRLRLAIVLDEAHRLAKDITLPKLMKEGRKFGISVIVASQGIGDFHQDVLSNAGTKILFRMNYPESRKVAGFIRGRQGQDISERIEQLAVGSAFVQTPEMPYGSVTQMYPLSE